MEIVGSLRFFVNYIQGKPSTRSQGKTDFGEAFGVTTAVSTSRQPIPVQEMAPERSVQPRQDEEEAILLRPYTSTEENRSV